VGKTSQTKSERQFRPIATTDGASLGAAGGAFKTQQVPFVGRVGGVDAGGAGAGCEFVLFAGDASSGAAQTSRAAANSQNEAVCAQTPDS
jgi:hypothetical protein